MNIIIEGVDRAGKSTLIRKLKKIIENLGGIVEVYSFSYPKSGLPKGLAEEAQKLEYFWTVENRFNGDENENRFVICDRFHLGEAAYGPIYRNSYPHYLRKLEAFMPKNTALVLLSPSNLTLIERRFYSEDYLKQGDIMTICRAFTREFKESILTKMVIDPCNITALDMSMMNILSLHNNPLYDTKF